MSSKETQVNCTCDPDPEDNEEDNEEVYDLEGDVDEEATQWYYNHLDDGEGQPDWLTEWYDFDPEA